MPEPNSGCILFAGYRNAGGYGKILVNRRAESAHRVAYGLYVGEIPDGYDIDHLCRNRACVNVSHMQAVPRQINALRGVGFCAVNARKTECSRGHPFDAENTGWKRTATHLPSRICLTCVRGRLFLPKKECIRCQATYQPSMRKQQFCSKACGYAARTERRSAVGVLQ
jgi:hypothetical protein